MRSIPPAQRPSFLSGVSILALSAVVVKIIGLLYRIPLLDRLGTEGMGYFNTAYELYALFCIISTAGLPVAMSVLIAKYEAAGRWNGARRVYRVSLSLFLGLGIGGSALLWGLSAPFAALLGNPLSAACMRAISPTVLLICLSSAFRGYFQGKRTMLPTAVSQMIEAGGKLFLGLAFAAYARGRGEDLPTTAAYAVLGLTVGTAISLLYLAIHKRILDARDTEACPAPVSEAPEPILRPLLATAIPVTLSAGVISLTKCLDLALLLRRLQAVGCSVGEANALYGCYSTLAVPVFNMIPSLTASIALSATPALSAALQKGAEGQGELRKTASSALGLALLVAVPGGLGISVFAGDILRLLFVGQPEAVAQATPWLSCLGLSVPAACLLTVTGAMLQSAGKAGCPIISMLLGVGCKTVLAYILLGTEGWGMMGMPVSSLLCDTVAVAINLCFIARHAPAMLPDLRSVMGLFGVPTLLAGGAILAVKGLRRAFGWQSVTPLHTLGTVICVACLYGAGVLICRLLRNTYKKKESSHEQTDQGTA